ncbi:unnamed protein product [Orchesella dallaii]|uniref:Gustatory receptor n=1 Tax=Orchesella dallaii TaxID=48710 RepID=A0ABP1S1N0_9HEXA
MSRNEQTEKVFVKSSGVETVRVGRQPMKLNKQGETLVAPRKLELFHWYFLAAYYGLIIPFKIKKREGDQVWETKSWMLQKLLCLLIFRPLVFLDLMTYLALNGREFFANKHYSPKDYLEIATSILYLANLFKFFWTLVIHREVVLKLFNDISAFSLFHLKEPSVPLSSRVSKRTTWFLTAYMLFMLVHCVGYISIYVIFRSFYDKSHHNTIGNGRKRFFLGDLQSNISQIHVNGTDDMYEIYSSINILVGFAEFVLMFSRIWSRAFLTTFFCGAVPVTFWSASKLFQRYLTGIDILNVECPSLNKPFDSSQADMIVEKYEELRNLVASLNSVWSTATLTYVICKSLELVVILNQEVGSKDMIHIVEFVGFTLLFLIMLVMLAEGCRINTSIKLWLCKKYTREQVFVQRKSELECLERDFEVAPVGIAVIGVCVISYGFLAQLLVFCVTVFLITF